MPTEPALSVPTPEPTPQHAESDPFQRPSGTQGGGPGEGEGYEGADRGIISVRNALNLGVLHKPTRVF